MYPPNTPPNQTDSKMVKYLILKISHVISAETAVQVQIVKDVKETKK